MISGAALKHKRYEVEVARKGPMIVDREPVLKAIDWALKAGIKKAHIAARIGMTDNAFRHLTNHATSAKIYRRNSDAILAALDEMIHERREALTNLASSIVVAKTKTHKHGWCPQCVSHHHNQCSHRGCRCERCAG